VDELPVPDRLEDAVREPQRQNVLDRLLAEVVVDAEDLFLAEVALDLRAQRAGRLEIVAEGLLDDQPRPALRRTAASERVHDRREHARRNGEVVDAVPI